MGGGRPIGLAVLGCSSIAERRVLPAALACGRFSPILTASRSPAKAAEFAARFGGIPVSYEEALSSAEVEAVYVSLPVGLHYEWGLRALKAGKHVLMEKTFCETVEQAEEMFGEARRRGLVLVEALMAAYHPVHEAVGRMVSEGAVGELLCFEGRFGFPFRDEGDIRHKPELGGGALLDCLVYPLWAALRFLGNGWRAVGGRIVDDSRRGVDVRGHVRIDWERASAELVYGYGFAYRNAYTLWGSGGMLTVEPAYSIPADRDVTIRVWKEGEEPREVRVAAADHFRLMLEDFYGRVRSGRTDGLNGEEDVLTRMRLMGEFRRCARRTPEGPSGIP